MALLQGLNEFTQHFPRANVDVCNDAFCEGFQCSITLDTHVWFGQGDSKKEAKKAAFRKLLASPSFHQVLQSNPSAHVLLKYCESTSPSTTWTPISQPPAFATSFQAQTQSNTSTSTPPATRAAPAAPPAAAVAAASSEAPTGKLAFWECTNYTNGKGVRRFHLRTSNLPRLRDALLKHCNTADLRTLASFIDLNLSITITPGTEQLVKCLEELA